MGRVECLAERRVAYMVLVGKPEGKSPLARLSIDGIIKLTTNLPDIGWGYGLE